MEFTQTKLQGAYVIELTRRSDDRGFFARAFCQNEFAAHDLKPMIAQTNIGFNRAKGTLRGLHFQYPPAAESKLVRCTRGAVVDVIVDLRPESATFLQHLSVELSESNYRALYVPERFAHGYQVLCDDTDVMYDASEFYSQDCEGGLRYDDPRLQLSWPLPIARTSEKDRNWKLLEEIEPELRRRMGAMAVGTN